MAATYWDPDERADDHDDLAHLREHFDPLSPSLTRGRYTRVAAAMARECPVVHTDLHPSRLTFLPTLWVWPSSHRCVTLLGMHLLG